MRWLHLCDLHLGKQDDAQSVAMNQLIRAVEETAGNTSIDFVLFAGDLAYSGQSSEYTAIATEVVEPLRKLSVTREALFVAVPGNHDLDCHGTYPIIWEGLGQKRKNFIWDPGQQGQELRLNRTKGFTSYNKFLKQANIRGPNPVMEIGSLVEIVGPKTISLVCLNTALFSDKDFTEADEKGKSPLPVQTLRQLAKSSEKTTQIIVVGHHPLTWFDVQSRNQFQSALLDYNAFYIHGHEHRVDISFGPNYLRSLGFGASYPARLDSASRQPYTSTFSLCHLDDYLHVQFTTWDPLEGTWRPLHSGLSSDVRERSRILPDGYVIPIPTTPTTTKLAVAQTRSDQIHKRHPLERPIWISGNRVKTWAALLHDMGFIDDANATTEEDPHPIASQSRFFVKGEFGTHIVHTASAETSVVTYDHVESANTQLDTLRLASCVIATFGTVTEAARNLASNLGRTKNVVVLDGDAISDALAKGSIFSKCRELYLLDLDAVKITPLAASDGVAMLVVDAVRNQWFSIVDASGNVCEEHESLVTSVRSALPQVRDLMYRKPETAESPHTRVAETKEFDRKRYLRRCLTLFDTAQYAGLAAVGVRMPVESLRRIYVPTSANVEQQQAAIKATERAIDELVESLGLDDHQRDELAKHMKGRYGSQKTSEVGAASKLYQRFANIAVTGDPGSGKSCFVRSEIMSYCEEEGEGNHEWHGTHLPLFLPLTEYVHLQDEPIELLDQCIRHANGQGLELDRQQLEVLLSRGAVAVFFDGLDEVSSVAARQKVLDELDALVDTYASKGNRFVLTSRPAAIRDALLPESFARISLLGLTDEEIELLVNLLFKARQNGDGAIGLRERAIIGDILRDCRETPGIRRLARNPLLLTLLVFVYENSGAFAARRHLIYSQATKTLVSVRHREIRRVRLSESDLRVRLGKLAVSMFRREESALPSRKTALEILADTFPRAQEVSTDFIQDVAETTGLLIVHPRTEDRSNDLVSFMHYSFLEYYTAIGFLESDEGFDTVCNFALNQRWTEIVTLMFGILGEQGDITERIARLRRGHIGLEAVTGGRLLLCFDCALECDVPPESTQRFLADELAHFLSIGSGAYLSDVRDELSERVGMLLEATGSSYLRDVLLRGMADARARVAGAYIDLVSGMADLFRDDQEVHSVLSAALVRKDRTLNMAAVNAVGRIPALRTDANLDRVRMLLSRGGIVEKTSVLRLIEEEPALIAEFERELHDLLHGPNEVLAAGAGSTVIKGGLFQREGYADLTLYDKSLRAVLGRDAPRRSLSGSIRVSWETIEEWIFSSESTLRERGFRSLAVIDADATRVHDLLFRCVSVEKEHGILTAILEVLASYRGAVQAASLAETHMVCKLTRSEYGDVRRAAARALRSFPTMEAISSALVEQFHKLRGRFDFELQDVIRSMASHAVRDRLCRTVLKDEISGVLRGVTPRWNQRNIGMVSELLFTGDQIGLELDERGSTRLVDFVRDYRTPARIRRVAMRLFGQTCSVSAESLRTIVDEFGSQDANRRLAAYRAGRRFVQRCRGRVRNVGFFVDAIGEAKGELLRCWDKEVNRVKDREDVASLREIRNFLMDIDSAIGSYQEFAGRIWEVSME